MFCKNLQVYLFVLVVFHEMKFSLMDVISNQYCADMNPQVHVTIEQLLGMWYGVEVINHRVTEEKHGVEYVNSCPIVHISEDNSPTLAPYNTGTINFPYGTTYGGSTYEDGTYQRTDYDNRGTYVQGTYAQDVYPPQYDNYGRKIYPTPAYNDRRHGSDQYPRRYPDEIKRLRILWTDQGNQVEYTEKYNTSKPGFWMSSGPQNGSYLEPPFNHFAGTVQVIKAVGNHLVLTFCHQLPDRQLFTAILSRLPKLTRTEISDVHDLLKSRALEINNVKRVCSQENSSADLKMSSLLFFGTLLYHL